MKEIYLLFSVINFFYMWNSILELMFHKAKDFLIFLARDLLLKNNRQNYNPNLIFLHIHPLIFEQIYDDYSFFPFILLSFN